MQQYKIPLAVFQTKLSRKKLKWLILQAGEDPKCDYSIKEKSDQNNILIFKELGRAKTKEYVVRLEENTEGGKIIASEEIKSFFFRLLMHNDNVRAENIHPTNDTITLTKAIRKGLLRRMENHCAV